MNFRGSGHRVNTWKESEKLVQVLTASNHGRSGKKKIQRNLQSDTPGEGIHGTHGVLTVSADAKAINAVRTTKGFMAG